MDCMPTKKLKRAWSKVGITDRLEERRGDVALAVRKKDVRVHTIFGFVTRQLARQVESSSHKKLEDYRLPDREWFDYPPPRTVPIVLDCAKSALLESGMQRLIIRVKEVWAGKDWVDFDLTKHHWSSRV
jgi:hypothetical protein